MNGVIVPFKSASDAPASVRRVPTLRDVSLPREESPAVSDELPIVVEGTARRVLVVDDDPEVRADLERALGQAGYEVDAAADGLMALALFGRRRPDVVITDMSPSRMADWELVRWVRRQNHALPVIVLGKLDDRKTAVAAMREGAQDYMPKPVDVAELTESLESVLAQALETGDEPA